MPKGATANSRPLAARKLVPSVAKVFNSFFLQGPLGDQHFWPSDSWAGQSAGSQELHKCLIKGPGAIWKYSRIWMDKNRGESPGGVLDVFLIYLTF